MASRRRRALLTFGLGALALVFALTITALIGFRPTTHATRAASLGMTRSSSQLEALVDAPGPILVETIAGADWKIDRSGLINLEHPTAKAAGLVDGLESIQIYVHVLRHPTKGTFFVDSGVERALRDAPDRAAMRGMAAKAMNVDAMRVRRDTATVVAAEGGRIAGVLLTHLHLDHLLGLPDVPKGTPIYLGPGESSARNALNAFVQPVVDRALEGHDALRELAFQSDRDGRFDGVLDLFGDGSLFAIWVPGHTVGSVAYLARTPSGPVLFTGDACHTAWGWAHDVEPGTFSEDRPRSATSLKRLRDLAARHPSMSVRLGHQALSREAH